MEGLFFPSSDSSRESSHLDLASQEKVAMDEAMRAGERSHRPVHRHLLLRSQVEVRALAGRVGRGKE